MEIYFHGRGAISAAGTSSAAAWRSYASGKKTWTVDAATGLPVYGVGALPSQASIAAFAASRSADRATELALYAAAEAVTAAGWQTENFSILVGCSRGPTTSWEKGFDAFRETGGVPTKTSPQTTLGGIGFALADYFPTSALASSLSVTCSSGFHALLHGVALLRSGMAERVLVGGAEAPLTTFTLRQMEALRITAPLPGGETHACRPFAAPPSGMVIGEGAAFFALSREPGPFELSGLSFARESAGSATGITATGEALRQTLSAITTQSGQPDFLVAHAPGTKRGDAAERSAIGHAYKDGTPPVSTSFKWATGHTFGASGPLALDAALSVLENQQWLGLPYAETSQPGKLRSAVVNATGFGGNAVSVGVGVTPPR